MRYVIRQTKRYYGPTAAKSLVTDHGFAALTFDSRKDAVKHKEMLDSTPYRTAHNEIGAPEYDVVRVSSLPKYLRAEIGQ